MHLSIVILGLKVELFSNQNIGFHYWFEHFIEHLFIIFILLLSTEKMIFSSKSARIELVCGHSAKLFNA